MDRLTERTADGIIVKEGYGEDALRTLYRCFGTEPMPNCANCDEGYCAVEKLADYEDLQDKLDKQFEGCIDMGMFIDSIIEFDKQLSRDEKLAEAIMLTNDEVRKYREWKSLEEQGKLLCAVGDTIYVIPSKVNYELNILSGHEENNRVYEQVVNRIEIFEDGYLLSTCNGMQSAIDKFYKKTWFLIEEEAKAALKELKRGNRE